MIQTITKRYPALILVVSLIAFCAVYFSATSRAASPTYYQVLNYTSAAQTKGVTPVAMQVNSLGAQTANQVLPGGKLTYIVGGKVPIKSQCYYFTIMPLKGGGLTAKIVFAGQGSAKAINVTYAPEKDGYLRSYCVKSGGGQIRPYNVWNASPSTGPAVFVYEDIVAI